MTDNETWQPLITALGWVLIHFIWQGTFVALLLAGVLRMLRGGAPNIRYAATCAALLLMLMAPLTTMTTIRLAVSGKAANGLSPVSAAQPESQTLTVEIEPAINPTQTANLTASPRPWLSIRSENIAPLLPWMVLLWLLGVVCLSLRLIGGWLYTRRLQYHGTSPLEERWREVLHRLCSQLRVTRPVRLLESAMIKVPMIVGWLRPVILLPATALTGLTAQQLEAVIAHELAHVRRHDYLVNLLQVAVETLLFYHPAVWWVSRQIRQEREHCCDDLAVSVCGDALTYARALLELEQLRAVGPQLGMAANGGLLMNRIQRLVGAQTKYTHRGAGLVAGIIALTTSISIGTGAQILVLSSSSADRQVVSADDRAAEALLPILQSISWDARKAAVERLAQVRGGRAAELLIAALKDEHAQVREQAVIGLGIRQDGRLVEPLITALTDREWQVREQAAIALGKVNDERAVEPLLKALMDSEWAVREKAARSLGTAGRERAVELLINALRDQHEQAREAAAKSSGIIGDRHALESLSQALQDVDEQARKKAGAAPQFIDPGFESFTPAKAPIYGWYSDELIYAGDERFGLVIMTPDATDKVEGKYSLRIEQPRMRPPNRGQAFLAQAVNFPEQWKGTRRFDLSAQMRGINGPVLIHVYVWEKNNMARVIAERNVTLTKAWSIATLKFDVPRGYDMFGVWFYLPRNEEAQIWLDDVRIRPREN